MSKVTAPFESPFPSLFSQSVIVSGAASLYRTVVDYRNRSFDRHPEKIVHAGVPVVSIGGIRAGGSGKTPATMLLIDHFTNCGFNIGVLSRGYKRRTHAPLLVAPDDTVGWKQIGDEPAMMRAAFPGIWLGIGADRSSSALHLEERMGEKSLFLLDDGFQHRRLHRNLDIVCIHDSVFSDYMLPKGYLREPIESLSRAGCLFLITPEHRIGAMRDTGEKLSRLFPHADQFLLVHKVAGWVNAHSGLTQQELPLDNPVALCGIARPDRFFEVLEEQGLHCSKKITFPDHHNYQEYDISPLRKLYSKGFVTTEKDAVRLKELPILSSEALWYLKMRLQFVEKDSLCRFNQYIKDIIF